MLPTAGLVNNFGDENTAVVKNIKLGEDIKHAQKRLNLYGGELPKHELLPMLKSFMADLNNPKELPPWVFELHKRYGLKRPEKQ